MNNPDVYAYGMISSSTLYLLNQPYPAADGYAEITQSLAMTGGEALNSSIVLSRLGVKVFLDGTWLGDTPEGRQLLERIRGYGMDASRLEIKKDYGGVVEIVLSDNLTRTVFGNYIDLFASTRKWNIPRKADLEQARMACLDPFFGEESILAARFAVEAGVPFVSIDCPYDHLLATEAAVVMISGEFRGREYPQADLTELLVEYQQRAKGLVIFTVGGETVLYARKGESIKHFQPYSVQVIDSAGAGDSFRAGVVYGLLQNWNDDEIVRYASAVAAMVCASFPGVLNSPTHAEVMEFIQKRA